MHRPGSNSRSGSSGLHTSNRSSGSKRSYNRPGGSHGNITNNIYIYDDSDPLDYTPKSGKAQVVYVIVCFIIAIMAIIYTVRGWNNEGSVSVPQTSTVRHKLDAESFDKNCITDEIGFIDKKSTAIKGMKVFWDKTGIQPVLLFKSYDERLTTDYMKQSYAEKWYEMNIDNESTFLFVYFEEYNKDSVGLMAHVCGKRCTEVMDSEAIDIFYSIVDKHWFSDEDTSVMISNIYKESSESIMKPSFWSSVKDSIFGVIKIVLIIIVLIIIAIIIIVIINIKNQREKEEVKETERILNTPLEKFSDNDTDNLVEKYGGNKKDVNN